MKLSNCLRSLLFSTLLLMSMTLCETTLAGNNNWRVQYQPSKAFVKNKGQFGKSNTVLYGYDGSSTRILFGKDGVEFEFSQALASKENEEEMRRESSDTKDFEAREKEERAASFKNDHINCQWENANPNVRVIAQEKLSSYFTYSFDQDGKQHSANRLLGYKKLTYKNIYPNIDVVYTFYPQGGIKYAIIVHPGGDLSQVKMDYSRLPEIRDGQVQLSTLLGNIIDHAPHAYYADDQTATVASRFMQQGNAVSFYTASYDHSRTLVIDPWVQTPTIPSSNCVWECDHDAAGNVYIIGGDHPMKLLKYNSAGTLQWTYVTPYDTAGGTNGDWLGALATDLAGNSYVSNGSVAALTKVNANDSVLYNVSGGSMDEYWSIDFNCDQTKLLIGGTRLSSLGSTFRGVVFSIDAVNGLVDSLATVAYVDSNANYGAYGDPNEVRALSVSPNGRCYYLTLDTLGAIDQSFATCSNTPVFSINNGYDLDYKCENYRPHNGNAGIKAIKANKYFLYTQNGQTIQKRSLATGAVISSASIPGGSEITTYYFSHQVANSGIDIDSCGNVYVGSQNAVIKYDANLNFVDSVNLPFIVYDVSVNTNGDVIACGGTGDNTMLSRTGYVETISSFNACAPMSHPCCDATVCNPGPFCTSDTVQTLYPATAGGVWSGTGITDSLAGTFDPQITGAGTFTVTYNLGCGEDSSQIVVNDCGLNSIPKNNTNGLSISCHNPVSGTLYYHISSDQPCDMKLAIYDVVGKCVYRKTLKGISGRYSNAVDMNSFANGMYLLELRTANKALSRKIIKQ